MQVATNKAITIHYTLTNQAGDVVDSSRDGDPLAYIHGIGALVPGLEKELEGKSAGDSVAVLKMHHWRWFLVNSAKALAPIFFALSGAFSTPPEALTWAPIYFMLTPG